MKLGSQAKSRPDVASFESFSNGYDTLLWHHLLVRRLLEVLPYEIVHTIIEVTELVVPAPEHTYVQKKPFDVPLYLEGEANVEVLLQFWFATPPISREALKGIVGVRCSTIVRYTHQVHSPVECRGYSRAQAQTSPSFAVHLCVLMPLQPPSGVKRLHTMECPPSSLARPAPLVSDYPESLMTSDPPPPSPPPPPPLPPRPLAHKFYLLGPILHQLRTPLLIWPSHELRCGRPVVQAPEYEYVEGPLKSAPLRFVEDGDSIAVFVETRLGGNGNVGSSRCEIVRCVLTFERRFDIDRAVGILQRIALARELRRERTVGET